MRLSQALPERQELEVFHPLYATNEDLTLFSDLKTALDARKRRTILRDAWNKLRAGTPEISEDLHCARVVLYSSECPMSQTLDITTAVSPIRMGGGWGGSGVLRTVRSRCQASGTASECTDLTAGKPDKNGLQWEGSYDWIDFLHYYVLQESRRILLKLSHGNDEAISRTSSCCLLRKPRERMLSALQHGGLLQALMSSPQLAAQNRGVLENTTAHSP